MLWMSIFVDKIVVLGVGFWGIVLVSLFVWYGYLIVLWGCDVVVVDVIDQCYENLCYLLGILLLDSLWVIIDLVLVVQGVVWILVVMLLYVFGEIVCVLVLLWLVGVGVVWVIKGFEFGLGCFLYEVVCEVLGEDVLLVVVIGLLFVKEVIQGLLIVIIVYGDVFEFVQMVVEVMYGLVFCVYIGDDMVGVELGGVMKNVLVVVIGVVDGMQLGFNVCVGLIICGFNEMLCLVVVIGVKLEMLMGLVGLGDLVLICIGDLLCNCCLGLVLGCGQMLQDVVCEIGQVVELVQIVDEVM